MPDDDACQVDAFLAKDLLLFQATLRNGMRMSRDRDASLTVRLGHRSEYAFDTLGQTRRIGGALQHACANARIGDSALDVAHEHIDHELPSAQRSSRSLEVEVKRNVVVGVDAGGDDDIDSA